MGNLERVWRAVLRLPQVDDSARVERVRRLIDEKDRVLSELRALGALSERPIPEVSDS